MLLYPFVFFYIRVTLLSINNTLPISSSSAFLRQQISPSFAHREARFLEKSFRRARHEGWEANRDETRWVKAEGCAALGNPKAVRKSG